MQKANPELIDYWRILVKRKVAFSGPFFLISAAAVALAMLLPAVYKSEATILIQRQSIPQNIVATTVTGYSQEQIQQILQRIITQPNLTEIAERFYLYPEELALRPSETVQKIRDNIEVAMLDVQATDPDKTGTRIATVAFTVAYSADQAYTAKVVTDELANRFLDEHRASREAVAAQVSDFLGIEAEALELEIAQLEQQLAGFKQEELRNLPELMGMNLSLYERTEQEIERTEEGIRRLGDEMAAVRAEMSLTPAYEEVTSETGERILTAEQRLSALTATYLQSSSRYSPKHPDIIRLAREIRVLAEQTGSAVRADELMNQLVDLQEQLRQARQQYTDTHPEVVRLETAVAAVMRGFQATFVNPSVDDTQEFATPPDNPRYVALKTQLDSLERNSTAERSTLENLRTKLSEYEERLFQTPAVEREFKSLSRGYDDALRKLSELKQKQLDSKMGEALESGQGAEKWLLLNQAFTPNLPESPNRIGIIALGLLLAMAASIGLVALLEYNDKSIGSAKTLAEIMGSPPLVVIPRISSVHSRVQKNV